MKSIRILWGLVISLILFGCEVPTGLILGSTNNYGSGVAQDTLIMKADSTETRISSITNDECVLSNNKVGKQVRSIYIGTEKSLILIKTNTSKSLLIGGDQPIKTTFGWIPVKELEVGALVYCINGLEMVVQINVQTYNSRTYNVAFDEEIGIYGNGILIGDYTMMRRMKYDQVIYTDR